MLARVPYHAWCCHMWNCVIYVHTYVIRGNVNKLKSSETSQFVYTLKTIQSDCWDHIQWDIVLILFLRIPITAMPVHNKIVLSSLSSNRVISSDTNTSTGVITDYPPPPIIEKLYVLPTTIKIWASKLNWIIFIRFLFWQLIKFNILVPRTSNLTIHNTTPCYLFFFV